MMEAKQASVLLDDSDDLALMMNRHRDAVLSAPPDLGFDDVCRGVPRVLEPLSVCFAVFHPAS